MQLLDSNREEPNEDTLECLCKLLGNVGEELDQTDFKVVYVILLWISGQFKLHIFIFFSFFEFFIWYIAIRFVLSFLRLIYDWRSRIVSFIWGTFFKKSFSWGGAGGKYILANVGKELLYMRATYDQIMPRRGEGVSQMDFLVIWTMEIWKSFLNHGDIHTWR